MQLKVERYKSNNVSTLGRMYIDDLQQCFTCEGAHHEPKIFGKTRIPAGTYHVHLKPIGSSRFDHEYSEKFKDIGYAGMLELQGVPDFEGVLIHIGNSAKDTEGCILLGTTPVEHPDVLGSFDVESSTVAFKAFYPIVRDVLQRGEGVVITVEDKDR